MVRPRQARCLGGTHSPGFLSIVKEMHFSYANHALFILTYTLARLIVRDIHCLEDQESVPTDVQCLGVYCLDAERPPSEVLWLGYTLSSIS